MSENVSVVAITLNEEHNLQYFIESAKKLTTKIFILDSFSSDKTIEIALNNKIFIGQRKFTNFGDQWNFAINNLPIKTEWIIKLDPDERLTDKVVKNIRNEIKNNSKFNGFSFDRRLFFLGNKLPAKQEVLRIWRKNKCVFSDQKVNEIPVIEGKVKKISGEILHYDSPSLDHWINKQNKYTTLESEEIQDIVKRSKKNRNNIFNNKRLLFIRVFTKIPFRYFFLFLYFYFIKGLFLFGKVGYMWASLRVSVYFWIEVKYNNEGRILTYNNVIGSPDSRCIQFK